LKYFNKNGKETGPEYIIYNGTGLSEQYGAIIILQNKSFVISFGYSGLTQLYLQKFNSTGDPISNSSLILGNINPFIRGFDR
jgi:hypothetical protein